MITVELDGNKYPVRFSSSALMEIAESKKELKKLSGFKQSCKAAFIGLKYGALKAQKDSKSKSKKELDLTFKEVVELIDDNPKAYVQILKHLGEFTHLL